MDNEKLYKEALERAKKIKEIMYPNLSTESCKAVSEYIDAIFPELEESNDERIRKYLLSLVDKVIPEDAEEVGININDVFVYLEKQKEQKPLTTEETELNSIAFLEQMGYTCIPPGKEQKPVEKQDYSGLNDFERAILRGFLSAGVENVPVTIIKETAKECLAQMKPVEWNEEDIKKIRSEEYTKGFNDAAFGGKLKEWSVEDEDRIRQIERIAQEAGCTQKLQEEIHDWLKSLRPQSKEELSEVELEFRGEKVKVKRPFFRDDKGRGYSTTEQDEEVAWNALRAWCEKKGVSLYDLYPKVEWSEEDEKMLTELLLTIEPSNNYDEMRNWLLLKLKSLLLQGSKDSLQTHWKPSEEQMSMLLAVINDPNNAGAESCYMALKSIYNNLKKL